MSTIKKSAMILAWTYDSFTYPRHKDLMLCPGIVAKIKQIQEDGKFINLDYYVRVVNQRAVERYGWNYKHNLINGRHA